MIMARKTPLVIVSLKSLCKKLSVASELDFSIFGGIFLCAFAFLGFRSLISNSISLNSTGSNLKLKFKIISICYFISNYVNTWMRFEF